MSSNDNFKFVQISDVHIKSSRYDPFPVANRKLLMWIINKVNEYEPHLILFTGDIIDAKSYRDPEVQRAARWFIRKATKNGKIPSYHTPGNHDIIHPKTFFSETAKRGRFKVESGQLKGEIEKYNENVVQRLINKGSNRAKVPKNNRKFIRALNKQRRLKFSRKRTTPQVSISRMRQRRHDIFHLYKNVFKLRYTQGYHQVKHQGQNIGIMNLNNSWMSTKSQDDVNDLYLCKKNSQNVYSRWNWHQPKFTIGMMHHPPYYLNRKERSRFNVNSTEIQGSLFPDMVDQCDVILSGHTHRQTAYQSAYKQIIEEKDYFSRPLHYDPINGTHTAFLDCFEVDLSLPEPVVRNTDVEKIKLDSIENEGNLRECLLQYQSACKNGLKKTKERLHYCSIQKLRVLFPVELEPHLDFSLSIDQTLSFFYDIMKKEFRLEGPETSDVLKIEAKDLLQTKECLKHYFSEFASEESANWYWVSLKNRKSDSDVGNLKLRIDQSEEFEKWRTYIMALDGVSGTKFFWMLYKKLVFGLRGSSPPFRFEQTDQLNHSRTVQIELNLDQSIDILEVVANQDFILRKSELWGKDTKNLIETNKLRIKKFIQEQIGNSFLKSLEVKVEVD